MTAKKKILVLDDDEDIGQMLKMMLEFKGYEVSLLTRSEQLLKKLSETNYQLLILDMLIAGENGCDICSMLKSTEAHSGIPILIFSALPDARKIALEAGADDFIAKPFEMNVLYEKVGQMIALHPDTGA